MIIKREFISCRICASPHPPFLPSPPRSRRVCINAQQYYTAPVHSKFHSNLAVVQDVVQLGARQAAQPVYRFRLLSRK